MITSSDNNLIKKIGKLADKKYRDQYDCFLIEGYRNVKDSISSMEIEQIVLSASACQKYADEFTGYEVVDDRVFAKISDTGSSQGVMAIAKRKKQSHQIASHCLFLDKIRDPGNLGTILRTAVACGFGGVYLRSCVDAYNPKVVRSAMSAIAKLDLCETDETVLDTLLANGYTVYCADMNGEDAFSTDFAREKCCLVIGNEANGITDEVLQRASKIISLPMENMESLNAAIAAAVIMYQIKYKK